MPNVVTYCRVSSDEQAQKDISIPAQRKAIHRWVDERIDHQIVGEFVDEGESAYAPANRRPGFLGMVSYCRKSKVDFILVHKLDRFSRHREESTMFKALLRRHGVQVLSITEAFEPDTPQGKLYEGIIEVFNEFYSMNLATETLKGMRENAERGHNNGGPAPYGYRSETVQDAHGREHVRLAPGPEAEVATVKRIFDLSANHGYGARRIANILNIEKAPGPGGRKWNLRRVGYILRNVAYVGDCLWGRTKKVGRDSRTASEPDRWITVPNAHEALVERDIFERSTASMAERTFRGNSPARPVKHLLSRLVRCERCGRNFVIKVHKSAGSDRVLSYYNCSSYLTQGKATCTSVPVREEWLDGVVKNTLKGVFGDPVALKHIEDLIRERIESRKKKYGGDLPSAERKLSEIDRRIANFYRAIGEGLDPQECKRHIAELTAQKTETEKEASILRQSDYYIEALETIIADLRKFAANLGEGFDDLPFGIQRKIILHFVQSIEIIDGNLARIHVGIPFDNRGLRYLVDETESVGKDGGTYGLMAGKAEVLPECLSGVEWGWLRRHPVRDLDRPRPGLWGYHGAGHHHCGFRGCRRFQRRWL